MEVREVFRAYARIKKRAEELGLKAEISLSSISIIIGEEMLYFATNTERADGFLDAYEILTRRDN